MNSKEIVDRMLDRLSEQAACIEGHRAAADQAKREAASAPWA